MTIAEATRNGRVAAFGQIFVDFDKMELRRDGRPVELTFLEFKVLKFFVQTPRRVVSRAELIRAVWPKRRRCTNRSVDNCISKLRWKLERNPALPVYFRTIHGVGYKFVPSEETNDACVIKAVAGTETAASVIET